MQFLFTNECNIADEEFLRAIVAPGEIILECNVKSFGHNSQQIPKSIEVEPTRPRQRDDYLSRRPLLICSTKPHPSSSAAMRRSKRRCTSTFK